MQLEYMTDLRLTAEAALSSVDLAKTMGPVDTSNAWAVFRAYLDAVAAQTTDELVPRWKDRLGGADVFTFPNAWAMAESLRFGPQLPRSFRHYPLALDWSFRPVSPVLGQGAPWRELGAARARVQ